jgi:3-oxoadipate enol-lactonase
MLERSPVEGYVGTAAALRDADLTQSTRALAIPVIALAGDADGSTPPDLVRAMAAIVPGADFRLIADAGHICCVEQPDEVAGVIRGFLTEIGYAGRMT